jgi:phosphoribosylaminoimidazole-succinocarboxamide synthase
MGRSARQDAFGRRSPDAGSSEFWKASDAAAHLPDGHRPSYDKQGFVRNWLETEPRDKHSPPPRIPADVQALAQARYIEIYETIVGRAVPELDG